jgi:penicillin-insensitive murein DD-endopeptidase
MDGSRPLNRGLNDEMSGLRGKTIDEILEKNTDPNELPGNPSDPTQGSHPQAIGFYSDGRLTHASSISQSGMGFVKLYRNRGTEFTSSDMTEILRGAALKMYYDHPEGERLQFGDLSIKNGGKLLQHESHQNGLDADIVYLRHSHQEQDPYTEHFIESFVTHGKLSPNFDLERNWDLLNALVATGRVSRIFVDAVIKRAFCKWARREKGLVGVDETLRRLRPYEKHFDHFHVRITCPLQSPKCITQEEPPEGNGCQDIGLDDAAEE